MDEGTLNDLLECSVCLERLDTSSKVLPCQHTFCKKCLEVIIQSHHELRCPECRVLVTIKIDDLPPNVLLMRILGGMKSKNHQSNIISKAQTPHHIELLEKSDQNKKSPLNILQINQQLHQQKIIQPHILNQPIQQRQTIASSQVQFQQKRLIPHAIALYDFKSKETFDLSFKKGDIIFIKRKIDANWFYGELNGPNNATKKEGSFPINYVKIMIGLPQPQCIALYDFKMGPSEEEGCLTFKKGTLISVLRRVDENWAEGRIANNIGIFPIAFAEMNPVAKKLLQEKPSASNNPVTIPLISNARALPPVPLENILNNVGDSTSTSSSAVTSPNSTCSSTSNSMPSSPLQGQNAKYEPNSENGIEYRNNNPIVQKEKRNSLNSLQQQGNLNLIQTHQLNRHSAEILSIPDINDQQASASNEISSTNSGSVSAPQKSRVNVLKSRGAAGQQNIPPSLPWAYMALYPYKPKKSDELELKKGCVYFVTERCLDGWFKGKNWQDKSGVFPGNYVTPLKNRDHQQLMHQRKHSHGSNIQIRTAENAVLASTSDQSPDLPPRGTGTNTSSSSSVWNNVESLFGRKSHNADSNAKTPGGTSNSKEKCETSAVGGLMKRLTNINKRSKSPVSNGQSKDSNYSADNPVFEDCSLSSLTQHIKNSTHPVHVRSGSCPSQLLQELPTDSTVHSKNAKGVQLHVGSQRLKLKERPSLNKDSSPIFTLSTSCATGNYPINHHRKTQSFDANSMSQNLHNSKSPIPKEGTRFRCIVSYPPNSEFELELNVGDIVYVQRKQKNGWYKGSKEGKVGLFPASFVEPDL